MPCKDSHIKISDEGSEIDIVEGDSVEIIDYKNHMVNQSITGSDKSLLQNIPIHTSDFLVLFLSERDSTGAEFKLQFECPVIINEDNVNDDCNELDLDLVLNLNVRSNNTLLMIIVYTRYCLIEIDFQIIIFT